ncbi:hypothetical protein [Vibrio sinensis]|nr:hypothetical protein [Vibrio sinensis]
MKINVKVELECRFEITNLVGVNSKAHADEWAIEFGLIGSRTRAEFRLF